MRLKLAAPFRLPEFELRPDAKGEAPCRYTKAWQDVRKAWGSKAFDEERVLSFDPPESRLRSRISTVRFPHATDGRPAGRSRYHTISDHDLEHPIHLLELELSTPEDALGKLLADIASEFEGGESVLHVFERPPTVQLVRVFNWRIGMFEADVLLDEDAMRALVKTHGSFETLRQIAIGLVERLVDDFAHTYASRLRRALEYHDIASFLAPPNAPTSGTSRTMWVTRSLVFIGEDGSNDGARKAIADEWVADIPEHDKPGTYGDPASVDPPSGTQHKGPRIDLAEPDALSMIWLNYVFREESYPDPYPPCGWRMGKETCGACVAQPFVEGWDAMLIAQYYYAAFEELQVRISNVLSRSLVGWRIDGPDRAGANVPELKLDESRRRLDVVVRLSQLLEIEYEDNRKYLARRVLTGMDEIFRNWRFEDGVRDPLRKRIEASERRMTRLQERRQERAQVRTDMIFVFIGVAAFLTVLMDAEQYYLKTGDAPVKLIVGGVLVFLAILPLFLYLRTSQRLSAE